MESHAIIERLKEVGYWKQDRYFSQIGISGATSFAAESACKALFLASERIRCDLEDGFFTIITKPENTRENEADDTTVIRDEATGGTILVTGNSHVKIGNKTIETKAKPKDK